MESTIQAPFFPVDTVGVNGTFYLDVISGLSRTFKTLPSKYFYDQQGDKLFQQIMACPEYYLTRCEAEILREQGPQICQVINTGKGYFDMIEMGAGDGTKTAFLLNYLSSQSQRFQYMPIDISGNILGELSDQLLAQNPDLAIKPLAGEYFDMLEEAATSSESHKVVMLLGSNIGNMTPGDAQQFCTRIRQSLSPGDMALIGFDLVKDPYLIRAAYSDQRGITKAFNLNLLQRINSELDADFNLDLFDHYCSYDPINGACKSYLVSQDDQIVSFPDTQIHFKEGECIWMEISQKYTLNQVNQMAVHSGFDPVSTFTDSKGWFADVVWKAV